MIRLRVQCPRCKKQRDWMTYYASSIQELVSKDQLQQIVSKVKDI